MGIEAAHARWFAFGGPDALDTSWPCARCITTCSVWVPGLSLGLRIIVSARFSARTPAHRAVYDLHGHQLAPRPGTAPST